MADRGEPPMAVAMQWVARVFAVSMVMVLPGIGGQWLDGRWQTRFCGPVGFAVGMVGGVAYLIAITRQANDSAGVARRVATRVARRRDADEGETQEQDGPKPGAP